MKEVNKVVGTDLQETPGQASGAYIFWLFVNSMLDKEDLIKQTIRKIKRHGFKGVCIRQGRNLLLDNDFFYADKYPPQKTSLSEALNPGDEDMKKVEPVEAVEERLVNAYRIAANECRKNDLSVWLHLDGRDFPHSFLSRYPEHKLSLLYYSIGEVIDNKYKVEIIYSKNICDHMDFARGQVDCIEKVFGISFLDEKNRIIQTGVIDLTQSSNYEVIGDEQKVWVTGEARDCSHVIAFLKVTYDTFDYASEEVIKFTKRVLRLYRDKVGQIDGIWSDEPGHSWYWDRIQVGNEFYKRFIRQNGYDLRDRLFLLVVNANSENVQSGKVRYDYHKMLAENVHRYQREWKKEAVRLWGEDLIVGLHQTNQETTSEDARRGTLDNFQLLDGVSAGFTDICSMRWTETMGIFLMVYAKSLAKFSQDKVPYVNIWDDSSPKELIDHTANLLGVYGCKWVIYNIGSNHPCWEYMEQVNARIRRAEEITQNRPPDGRCLVVYNVDTVYWLGDSTTDLLRPSMAQVVSGLERSHYPVDIVSANELHMANSIDGKIVLNGSEYDVLIFPFPFCLREKILIKLQELYGNGSRIIMYGSPPMWDPSGKDISPILKKLAEIKSFSFRNEARNSILSSEILGCEMPYGVDKKWMDIGERIYTNKSYWVIDSKKAQFFLNGDAVGITTSNEDGGRFLFLGLDIGALNLPSDLLLRLMSYFQIAPSFSGLKDAWITKTTLEDGVVISLASSKPGQKVSGTLEADDIVVTDIDCHFRTMLIENGKVKKSYQV